MRVRAVLTSFAVLAGLGGVAACGDNTGTTVSTTDGKVKGDEGDNGKAEVGTPGGTPTVGQGLPEGFPEAAVPLVEERVVSGATGAAGGPFAWTVVMTSSRAIDDLSKEVTQGFSTAGYTATRSRELGDVSIHQFTNDTYEVGVTIARTGDGITITYLVKNRP